LDLFFPKSPGSLPFGTCILLEIVREEVSHLRDSGQGEEADVGVRDGQEPPPGTALGVRPITHALPVDGR